MLNNNGLFALTYIMYVFFCSLQVMNELRIYMVMYGKIGDEKKV